MENSRHRLERFCMGSASAIMISGTLQPLDVIRTQQQGVFQKKKSISPSFFNTMHSIKSQYGYGGLWRGTSATIARVGLGAGAYFSLLPTVLSKFPQQNVLWDQFGAAAVTRAAVGTVLCPLTVIKTRMEWELKSKGHNGLYNVAFRIWKQEGVAGWTRGLGPTLLRDAPASGLYFMMYTQFKDILLKKEGDTIATYSTSVNLVSGFLAGILTSIVTHPVDTLKTRMQLQPEGHTLEYRMSLWTATKRLYAEEGLCGFFRGLAPRLIRRAGTRACTWTLFEYLQHSAQEALP